MAFKMNGWSAFTKPDWFEKERKETKEIEKEVSQGDVAENKAMTEFDPFAKGIRDLDNVIDQKRKEKPITLKKKEYKGPPKS